MNRPLIALWTLFGSWFVGGIVGYFLVGFVGIYIGSSIGILIWLMIAATFSCLEN